MPIERAKEAYAQERLNCAQSVLRGFQELHGISEEEIAEAKKLGGGRAENGCCGALHAACLLASDSGTKERIRTRFASVAGADKCREIRSMGQLSCGGCVELAARLLAEESQEA